MKSEKYLLSSINYKNKTVGRAKKDPWAALLLSIFFVVISLVLLVLTRIKPGFGTFYATTIYPIWQSSLGRVAGLFPFSLSEALICLLPLLLLIDLVRYKKRLRVFFAHVLLLASFLFFLYSANCGVNYYRKTFMETENIPFTNSSAVAQDPVLLERFCQFAVEGIKANQGTDYPRGAELEEKAVESMEKLGATYKSLAGYYPKPKPIMFSRFFSNMEVTGIYSPLTIEANYNREIPAYNLPYTACHELSHLKGFMDEGEANFIGWLACLNSDDKSFNRTAYMFAWIYGGNALKKESPEKYSELRSQIPEETIIEFQENNAFWKKYRTKAADVQDKVNDAYLKSNGQKDGVKSYDRVLLMMLSWFQNQ